MDEFLNKIINFFTGDGITIANTISVFIFGLLAVKLIMLFINKVAVKAKIEKTVSSFMLSVISVALYFVLLLCTGKVAGISTASFVALISAAGLAISLALKDSLSNLANGFIILGSKPFVVGDYVEVNGVEGNVMAIGFFNTKLVTVDKKIITLPNSTLIGSCVINYSTSPTRRLDINLRLSHDADVEKAKEVMLTLAKEYKEVLIEPAPVVYVTEYTDSALSVSFRMWVPTESYWGTKFNVNERLLERLHANGIELSRNKLDVNVKSGGIQ